MSSEDPGHQDPPPSDDSTPDGRPPAGDGNDETAPYGYAAPGGPSPYGAPPGAENPYEQAPDRPAGPQAGGSPGAYGVYGQDPYGAPSYGQPTYQQPSGYPPPPPQWGHPQQPGYPYGPGPGGPGVPQENDGLALAAMITGIVSLVLTCGYGIGLLGSPVALVLGRVSMKRIDRSQGRLGGRGMALTGFILGIIGTVLLVLALIAVVVVIVVAVNGGFDTNAPSSPAYNS